MMRPASGTAFGHPARRRQAVWLIVLALLGCGVSFGSGGPVYTYGIVYTRGLVLGPNNAPIFAEFDEEGIASTIPALPNGGEAIGELADAQVMDAATYRGIEQAYRQYLQDNGSGVALGARVMSADEYQNADLGEVSVPQPDGQPDLVVRVPRVPLLQGSRSALIRDNQTIPDPRLLGDRGAILFEAPIDLSDGNLQTLGAEIVSLILDGDGRVLYASQNNIGFRAAYIRPDEGVGDPSQDHISIYRRGDDLWGGIDGALIESTLGGLSATTDGRFTVIDFIPPCPGFSFEYDFNIYASLAYRNFNPQAPRPYNSYYFRTSAFEQCWGYGEVPLGYSLTGLSATLSLQSIGLTLANPLFTHKMPVDIVLFNGLGEVANVDGVKLPVEEQTEYDASVAGFADMAPVNMDLDLDQTTDWVSEPGSVPGNPGDPALIGVYLGETGQYGYDASGVPLDEDGNPVDPDLVRLADQAADFEHRGLLKRISVEDLENTDIYVYRVSNGQLIVSKEGLDRVVGTAQGVDDAADRFYYKLIVPGPKSGFAVSGGGGANLEAWQEGLGVAESLLGRNIDSLRPGEPVKIVAINRVTGYIGTVTVPIEAPTGGFLDFPVERLLMQPPNLKVRAERLYRVEHGLTRGEERQYLVGSEGSALTTDTYVALYTEWLDQDGTPLPDDLEGYTGRLAKVGSPNELVAASPGGVEFFQISPGTQIQLVKLEGDILGTEHFYLHVHGAKSGNQADFSPGDGSGVLQYRPGRYVPVRVPVYDEPATRQARNTASYAGNNPNDIDPIYQWPYRPEMQFSVFDLEVQELRQTSPDGNFENVIDLDSPEISVGDTLDIIYDFLGAMLGGLPLDPLPGFGPGQQLVFSFAGYEIPAVVGADGRVHFGDLDFLDFLEPEGYLLLSLYQNSDAENVLWEFAFNFVDLDTDSDNNNGTNEPDRTELEDVLESGSPATQGAQRTVDMPTGKIVFIQKGDEDHDGYLNFADFSKARPFVPVMLELGNDVDIMGTRIKFEYSGTNPAGIVREGDTETGYTYTIPAGHFRLWVKDGDEERQTASLNDGGDYLVPGEGYSAADLGFTEEMRVATFYLEAVRQHKDSDGVETRRISALLLPTTE